MFPIKHPPQYCEKREQRQQRLGRVPTTPRPPAPLLPGDPVLAPPPAPCPNARHRHWGRVPSPPALPGGLSAIPCQAGDTCPHGGPRPAPEVAVTPRCHAGTPVPAFLALIEAVLAVEDIAVAVVVQVAHGQEGGGQAPGEAGVPWGWGHGGQGGRGARAGARPPRGISVPCHGAHRTAAARPRTAPAINALLEPVISSGPATSPPRRELPLG